MNSIEIKDERAEHSRYAVYLDGLRIGFASCVQVRDTIVLPFNDSERSTPVEVTWSVWG